MDFYNKSWGSGETPDYGMDSARNSSGAQEGAWESTGLSFVFDLLIPFICLAGLAGNGLVLWILIFRLPRTPFTVYILHLAVADSCFLLCQGPVSLVYFGSPWTDQLDHVFSLLQVVTFITYVSGLGLLTAVSVERCLSVLFPLWYRCHRPKQLSAIVCALLWALSALLCILATHFCSPVGLHGSKECIRMAWGLSTVFLLIFTPLMVLSSATVFVRIQWSPWRSLRSPPAKLYVVILAAVLVFLICALPLGIDRFLFYCFRVDQPLSYGTMELLACVGSSANPVIYLLVGCRWGRGSREPLTRVLQRTFSEASAPGGPRGPGEVGELSRRASSTGGGQLRGSSRE
ncbi:mas-related G-protein coupled receptor member D-like [Ornithorhynchus anatinus]|uniref:G-protein coupled receptors family 1 profile domain-containing protein n=1 Tax=Ornithorhynchus anatinus TaxID=9258 RepID=A0A6I8PK59_ORNAN|nr:mas-related G-protein coupled receptor member D-like [Ornithorhynchus anatinus]